MRPFPTERSYTFHSKSLTSPGQTENKHDKTLNEGRDLALLARVVAIRSFFSNCPRAIELH